MHTESLEKAGTYAAGLNRLRAGVRAQKIAARGKDIDRAEGFIQSLPVKKIRIRERPERRFNGAFVHRHQPAGTRIRKRLQQSRVDKAKDSDACADAESQNESRRHSKTGILAQLPQSEAEILQHPLKPERSRLMTLLSEAHVIPELTIRGMPRIVSRHALRAKLLLRLRAMKGHLLFKFTAEFFATDKYPQLPEKTPHRFHRSLLCVLQHSANRGNHHFVLRKLLTQLLAAWRSQRVVTRPSVGLRLFPLRFDPPLQQQPLQRRIERAFFNRQ